MVQSAIKPRRQPRQARSRERVDRILDAAAQLLLEEGYDAVKTNHIARRAGVSIGSIYQFFPNRVAIFHALAVRYLDRISEVLAKKLATAQARPWRAVIDDVIDTLAEIWRTEPAFITVWLAIQNTAELRASDEQYNRIFVQEYLTPYLANALPDIAPDRRDAMARIIFEICQRLLDYSMQANPQQDAIVVEELKLLLKSYIAAHASGSVTTGGEAS